MHRDIGVYKVVVSWTDALGFPGRRSKRVQAKNAQAAIQSVKNEVVGQEQTVEFKKATALRLKEVV